MSESILVIVFLESYSFICKRERFYLFLSSE